MKLLQVAITEGGSRRETTVIFFSGPKKKCFPQTKQSQIEKFNIVPQGPGGSLLRLATGAGLRCSWPPGEETRTFKLFKIQTVMVLFLQNGFVGLL